MKAWERGSTYIKCIGACFLCLASLVGCTKGASLDAADVAVLQDACKALGKTEAINKCYDSLAKTGGEAAKNIKRETDAGMTNEEVAFKGIPLDTPDQAEKLMAVCQQEKSNLESYSSGYKSENKCKLAEGRTWFQVDYGSLEKAYFHFNLSSTGELLNVWSNLKGYEVQPLTIVLTEKYGKPKIQDEEVRNGLGNIFNKQVITWVDRKGNAIIVNSIYNKVDEGRFEIQSASYLRGNLDKAIDKISAGKERL